MTIVNYIVYKWVVIIEGRFIIILHINVITWYYNRQFMKHFTKKVIKS